MKTYLLIGNYGVGNIGDEALQEYFLTTFRDVSWVVVSASAHEKNEVPRLPFGLRSLFTPWWKTLWVLKKSDGIVFGGGTLFTDSESVLACFLWSWHAVVARLLGKKIILASQGIGPFQSTVGEWCARKVVGWADYISVRDTLSTERVEKWDLNKKIIQTFDPIYSLFINNKPDVRSQNILIVIPRKNSDEAFVQRAIELSKSQPWQSVHILSMQPGDHHEKECTRLLADGTGGTIIPIFHWKTLLEEVAKGGLVLSQRFHGSLAAIACAISCESISRSSGDKLAAIAGLSGNVDALQRITSEQQFLEDALEGD